MTIAAREESPDISAIVLEFIEDAVAILSLSCDVGDTLLLESTSTNTWLSTVIPNREDALAAVESSERRSF